ncbi:MAG: uroporphyrinogen decarboxylase family protein [Negativicutes bacterium]|jgi:MtaA/CmuA family methyltransferase
MTPKQRYEAMLKGQPYDIVPRTPILMRLAAEQIGAEYIEFTRNHKVMVKSQIFCAEKFGIDQLSVISGSYGETQGYGGEISYRPLGPYVSHLPLGDTTDLSTLRNPDPFTTPLLIDRLDAIREYRRLTGDNYSVCGWIEGPAAQSADMRGIEQFLMDLIEEQEFCAECMDLVTDKAIIFAKAQCDAGADTIGVGDAIASQISLRTYKKLVFPREKRLFDAIKALGCYTKLHICGNITHLLPAIAGLDVDIIDIDHMVDIKKVREILGQRVTITGNIDPVLVMTSNPETIEQAMRETYTAVGAPYLLNAGCEVPPGTPDDNLKALCLEITI